MITRLYHFQIEKRDSFVEKVPGTRTVNIREPGVRGKIVDRSGKVVLADNLRAYEISLNLKEIHQSWNAQHQDQKKYTYLTRKNGMPSKATGTDIVSIVEEMIIPRLRSHQIDIEINSQKAKAIRVHYLTHGGLVPYTFPIDLTYDQFSKLAEHNLEMPGLYVAVRPRREYPYGALACHILGYTKQWAKGDIPEEAKREYDHYFGESSGAAGIESTMNDFLVGPEGKKTYLKNEKNKVLGLVDRLRPSQGATVQLSIDARIQYMVENMMRRIGRGSATVMDPNTGAIIAMVSVPNYNPNHFIPSITQKKFDLYRKNKAAPFLNRNLSSFMPGSTFKIPVAVTGCIHQFSQKSHSCKGHESYGRRGLKIHCWNKQGHGRLNLANAIKRSCNPYFMHLANEIGSKRLINGFQLLGFGKKTGIELPNESTGKIPGDLAWQRLNPGKSLTQANLALTSIGQWQAEATPIQITSLTSAIANGGIYYKPRIVKSVTDSFNNILIPDKPTQVVNLLKEGASAKQLESIRRGMWRAVHEQGGTAGKARLTNIEVAAKTGTVQEGPRTNLRHNAWTTAFAPYKNPRYAVTVYVQGGKSGGKVAGSLVQMILRGLFDYENGQPLPLAKQDLYFGHFDPIEEIIPPSQTTTSFTPQTP